MYKVGDWISICSFKHDSKVHRIWDRAMVLDITDDYVVVGNKAANVIESDGRCWQAKDPAITVFFKNKWYNIISMIRHTGVHYYCNIASPYAVANEKEILYIDYDLDLALSPDDNIRILDEYEYERHRVEMGYSKELDIILKESLQELKQTCILRNFPFDESDIYNYYQKFLSLL